MIVNFSFKSIQCFYIPEGPLQPTKFYIAYYDIIFIIQCGTINGAVGGCGVGSSNRIYRDLETGFSTSGSSRAGSTGSTGVSGTVVRPATLDFTDIGEEATAYSDDNLCEDQTMVGD